MKLLELNCLCIRG